METKAPDGYQLQAQPIPFRLTTEGVVDLSGLVNSDAGNTAEVVNQPDNLNNRLPLTGGQGVALVSLIGGLLVAGGLGYYLVSRRKQNA
ncbi:LPXTG cell wall anchor domain-containing protein [Enemella sp. A6]|uniref:LPXTG cell wall anchor domain-containing protein n=1 Tax=Enemella sp. A6 TaxID=3440152 RepID=UPI003EBA215A